MNMLTGLKALLLATPIGKGAAAPAVGVEGGTDFAQLLSAADHGTTTDAAPVKVAGATGAAAAAAGVAAATGVAASSVDLDKAADVEQSAGEMAGQALPATAAYLQPDMPLQNIRPAPTVRIAPEEGDGVDMHAGVAVAAPMAPAAVGQGDADAIISDACMPAPADGLTADILPLPVDAISLPLTGDEEAARGNDVAPVVVVQDGARPVKAQASPATPAAAPVRTPVSQAEAGLPTEGDDAAEPEQADTRLHADVKVSAAVDPAVASILTMPVAANPVQAEADPDIATVRSVAGAAVVASAVRVDGKQAAVENAPAVAKAELPPVSVHGVADDVVPGKAAPVGDAMSSALSGASEPGVSRDAASSATLLSVPHDDAPVIAIDEAAQTAGDGVEIASAQTSNAYAASGQMTDDAPVIEAAGAASAAADHAIGEDVAADVAADPIVRPADVASDTDSDDGITLAASESGVRPAVGRADRPRAQAAATVAATSHPIADIDTVPVRAEDIQAQPVTQPTTQAATDAVRRDPAVTGNGAVRPSVPSADTDMAQNDAQPLPETLEAAQAVETAAARPMRAQAVPLLQLMRDHMTLRSRPDVDQGGSAVTAQAAATDVVPDAGAAFVPVAMNDGVTPVAAPAHATAPVVTSVASVPTVDLSASIDAQVVDMGVSGQWIDGLAREIAGLSANGAQGRFQINATQLGPVQVDIQQGVDGAAVSLTVANEAAEMALRQDSERLKLDSGLTAMRINEVRIERIPHVSEVARADTVGHQNGQQSQSQSHGGQAQAQGQATGGQNMGQSSAQSHMQGRGQQRENIPFGGKAGNDASVLNHIDADKRGGGAVRARYA